MQLSLSDEPFNEDMLVQRVNSELALYEKVQPKAVIIGLTISTVISARVAGIPLVFVRPFPYSPAFIRAGYAHLPEQFHNTLTRMLPDAWVDRMFSSFLQRTKAYTGAMNKVARRLGLKGFDSLLEMLDMDYNLITDLPEITGVPQLPPRWYYVGPIYMQGEGEVPIELHTLNRSEPVIYFAMGSSGERAIVLQLLDVLSQLPYQVIAPIQRLLDEAGIEAPDNVKAYHWLPAHKVNPLADIAIIHGGQGTVQTACASATPFLGIGMQFEQDANIEFSVKAGMALRLPRNAITAEGIQSAVTRLLREPAFKQNALEVQRVVNMREEGRYTSARFIQQTFCI